MTALTARVIADAVERRKCKIWIDRTNLDVSSNDLKTAIGSEVEKADAAIICLGLGDLSRCSDRNDFFRWELDTVREWEKKGLRVVLVIHGTTEL